MAEDSPPESIHALDLDGLKKPEITFWCAWEGEELLGCGAMKELSAEHAELKSMRTAKAHLRKGVARQILTHIIEVARSRGTNALAWRPGRWIRLSRHAGCMKTLDSNTASLLQIIYWTRIVHL